MYGEMFGFTSNHRNAITTIKYFLPPASLCKITTEAALTALKAGEAVGESTVPTLFRKASWQQALQSLEIFILFT